MDDIISFGNNEEIVSSQSVLAHEVVEQAAKQLDYTPFGGASGAHEQGITAESSITGFKRINDIAGPAPLVTNANGSLSGELTSRFSRGSTMGWVTVTLDQNNIKKVTRKESE